MKARTAPTNSKMIRNTPIKIPARLLRLASGSPVAVNKNQVSSVNRFNAKMNIKILLAGFHTFPLVFLGRISIRISLPKLVIINRDGEVKGYVVNDTRLKFGIKINQHLGLSCCCHGLLCCCPLSYWFVHTPLFKPVLKKTRFTLKRA